MDQRKRDDRRSRARGRGALRAARDQRQPGALALSRDAPIKSAHEFDQSEGRARGAVALARQPAAALDAVELTGAEPVLPSSFAVGTAAQASIAAAALAAAELWRLRTGRRQRVSVDMRDAAIEFRSERYMRVDGEAPKELWDKIAGLYRCGDGRWVRLHTNFPHHRDGVLKLLGCDYSREAVQRALDGWQGEAFETAAAEAGLVVTMTRSFAEWDAHGQGRAVAALPAFTIEKIGDAPPQPLPAGDRPLAGVRVLDLTRVIAGPVCGRTLAAHGADVLLVTAAHLPQMMPLVIDNGRGKLSTFIDLRDAERARHARRARARGRHFRAGLSAGRGRRATASAPKRPRSCGPASSMCRSPPTATKARGRTGAASTRWCRTPTASTTPKREAAGADSRSRCPARRSTMRAGFLMAFGAMTALARRATRRRKLARARVAGADRPLDPRPRAHATALPAPIRGSDDVRDRLEESDSGFGRLTAVRHAARCRKTPPRWARPSVPLGTHAPEWPIASRSKLCPPAAAGRRPRSRSSCATPAARTGRAPRARHPDSGRKRAIIAAIATSAARAAPSSHLSAMPSPCSGSAPQNTPSAPVFTSTRAPNSCHDLGAEAAGAGDVVRLRRAGRAQPRRRLRALWLRGPARCRSARTHAPAPSSGTAQVGIEQPSMPH